ncbi:hypothetical protein I7I51_08387 [Histoplasma capsulatum]|uniref:Mediator of RNA polymerase II transcription subunit 12 n=1 Tax=Ajellomyces capsulatus TaxID=5037 RepID=A0A8A1M441_AJECA|nr:hypothetical protein I7I51_08387 [Histoplasma capsulatum]
MNPLDLMNASSTEQTARPPWSFPSDIRRTGPGAQTELAQWSQSASLPPLPIRPWKYGIQERYVAGATNQKKNEECGEVTTTPYRIDVPSIAPRFADNKPADFAPWRGSHPEDVLSEQTIKQGFHDRSPVPPTESTSARTSVYPHFKRRSGLKLLSSVFAAALEKRQALCTITAASTFRPPPRVTLTDIKREAWLRDLANPSIPLRRLSRTIPHGIRGKLLLDQCLGKSIPICRAIWLAKCVGANELRAFKRKGTSAGVASGLETKWVRDWTVSVQQFIEGVIASFGDASWKLRISYSIRLSARIFLEHLIEQDHFLDWFLTSLDNSSFESLPVWLLMVGVYWQNIVRYRKRAKRLAECLLEKLRLVSDAGQNAHLNPVAQRLSRLTKTLTLYHPSSFILPRTWAKYESVLSSCLDMNLPEDKAAFQNLKARNTRHVSADIGLLGHLPPHRLPSHIWNLRNTLLSRTGFSVALENDTIQLIKASVRRRLPHMFPMLSIDGDAEMTDDVDLTSLSWTVRSEIGNWIRNQVASHVKNSLKSAIDRDFASEAKTSALTPQEFFEVRYILECLCDFSMLADVLKYASGSNNVTVVASAVDTLNYHLDSFNAIGATGDLFKSFTGAYARISKTELSVQDLIASLLDVAIKLPAELSTLSMLRRDQLQRDRKLAMAACSPVSDHIVDTLNTANPTFTEELDQLLTSGNSMDESTMARIFDTLRKKLEAGSINGEQSAHETARYFANLRPFNTKLFDNLMIKWVISVLRTSPRPKLSSILPPLIGVGCVTLHSFYVLARAFLHSDAHKNAIPDLAELRIDMIQLLDDKLSNGNGSQGLVAYRFKIARQGYMRQYSGEALGLIQDLLANLSENGVDTPPKQFNNDMLSTIVTPLLCEIIVRHPSIVGLAAAERTIESINDFSLPLCLINLRLLFNFECDNDVKKRIYDVVFEAAKSNMHKGQSHWIDVVGTLHADAATEIRQRAEEQLLSLVLSSDSLPASPVSKSGAPTSITASALVCLRIVENLSFSVPENGSPSLGPMLIEKMNMILHRITILESHIMNINITQYNDQAAAIRQAHATQESAITFWFYILLRLVSIHRSTFTPGTLSKSDLADQSRLLISITCIALSKTLSPKVPSAQPYYIPPTTPLTFAVPLQGSQPQPLFYSTDAGISTNLRTQALDVAATLLDSIPDDSRHQCSRFFRDRCPPFLHPQNNPRLFFLLGPLAADTQPSSSTMQSSQQQPVVPNLSQTTLGPPASTATPAAGAPPGAKSNSSSSQQFQSGNIYNTTNFLPFDDQNSLVGKLRVQHPGGIVGRFPLRPWEMLEESAPVIGVNDTAVDLGWFAARKVRGDVT